MEHPDISDEEYEQAYWLKREPWRAQKLVPIEWLRRNFHSFVHSPELILERAEPYEWMAGPHSRGIYFLILDNKIVYTGKSIYIRTRLRQHLDAEMEFTHFWCFDGVPELFLDEVESYYIHLLRPTFNRKFDPPGEIASTFLEKSLGSQR